MTSPSGDKVDLIRRMPKVELHVHLDGSLRPGTALELARDQARTLDDGQLALIRGLLSPDVFDSLETLDLGEMRQRLTAPMPCRDQRELLEAFDLPTALLQDAGSLERAARELVEDVAADGTRYLEIRWAPSLHADRGLSLEDVIEAVGRGARSGSDATGVVTRLIVVALRTHPVDTAVQLAHAACASLDAGVSGFDCAGREADAPDPRVFDAAWAIARDGGLGLTCHAGEWNGPTQVRRALELGVRRVAHGAVAAADPALVAELARSCVTLDLCPTSNAQAGVVASLSDHPLPRLHRAGVPVTLSTDDRTVSDVTLVDEYLRAYEVLGLTVSELWAINRHAIEVAFLHHDEPLRARLAAELDAWASGEPLLRGTA